MKMQMGIYFNQTRCTGCQACAVACKDWHDIPAGPSKWLWITTNERGRFPNLSVSFLVHFCYQCENPACVEACPADIIAKRKEDGIVVVDQASCLGKEKCGLCLEACPYKAPQFRVELDSPMEKCDLCVDRWTQGRKPVCVDSCPTRALDAGPVEELIKRYGDVREAEGFDNSAKLRPAILFKPKKGEQ